MILATFISALVTIYLGAFVRISGSGLGCPDWPLCHGRLIPPPDVYAWVEWSHRTSAAITFILVLIYAITAARKTKYLSLLPLGLIIGQVILGAITVITEIDPTIALIHTIIATAFIGSLGFLLGSSIRSSCDQESKFKYLLLTAIVGTFLVIITGALVTRSGASPVCTTLPLCFTTHNLDISLKLHFIQFVHRIFAFGLFFVLIALLLKSLRVGIYGTIIVFIIGLSQVTLGILNIALSLPDQTRILHVATAGSLFGTLLILKGYTT